MDIRPAEIRDGADVFQLVQAFATSFAVEQAAFDLAFAELLTDPNAFIAVAETDGKIAGYILGFEHLTFFANGSVAWVEEITVGEPYRRFGVGRRLMEAFETWAAERNVKMVALATRRAAGFYEALGYEESAAYFRKIVRKNHPEGTSKERVIEITR